jgi:hypothetical protein
VKINSSENYLNLIVGALDISIIPELNSASSRGAADRVGETSKPLFAGPSRQCHSR